MGVQGKVAVVTGAAGGLGAAMARAFAKNGAEVWLLDLNVAGCEEIVKELEAQGCRVHAGHLDVGSEEEWKARVDEIAATSGKLDVLVNNAGINIRKPIEEMVLSEWMTMMHVNTGSVFLGCKYAIPVMRAQGGGSIINMSSICGLVGHKFTPECYTATKGAITLMTKSIASRYAKDGIRCNSIHPSTADTPLVAAVMNDPEKRKQRLEEVPLGRYCGVDDVANAALYLAGDESSYITGVNLPVDGGMTCC